MKCRQIIKQYGHLRFDELPDEVRALAEQDPTCREWFASADSQRDLLSLKRHEQPEAALYGRITYQVRVRIEAGEQLPTPELATPRGRMVWAPTVTVAALALFGASYHFFPTGSGGRPSGTRPAQSTPATIALEQRDTSDPRGAPLPAQPRIEDLFKPIPTETNSPKHIAGNTNVFPNLVPSKPGRKDTRRVIGPPQP